MFNKLNRIRESFRKRSRANNQVKASLIVSQMERYIGDVKGTRILDLGADAGGKTVSTICEFLDVKEAIGVNPAVSKPVSGNNWSVIPEDARQLPFQDEEFDHIVSVAAFEHFQGLSTALDEAYRVLRKGGKLITTFGPIWSGCWGHHLWVNEGGERYTYINTRLPPWAHLLMSREELHDWLAGQYSSAVTDSIVRFVYESDEQNRMFYDQYEKVFSDSPFKVNVFSGSTNHAKRNEYEPGELEQAFANVKQQYSDHHGFEYDSINVVLEKQ